MINLVDESDIYIGHYGKIPIHVVRGYIIPEYDITQHRGVSISKNPNRGVQWYEEYRIKDIKPYDDVYQEILKDIKEGRDPTLRR